MDDYLTCADASLMVSGVVKAGARGKGGATPQGRSQRPNVNIDDFAGVLTHP